MVTLIGSIVVTPSQPKPSEPVKVEVFGTRDASPDTILASVTINGTPGAVQYLQFPTAGVRKLLVIATASDGTREDQTIEVPVEGEPVRFLSNNGHLDSAMIGVSQAMAQPYEAVLTLGSYIDARQPRRLRPTGIVPKRPFSIEKTKIKGDLPGKTALTGLFLKKSKGIVRTEIRSMLSSAKRPLGQAIVNSNPQSQRTIPARRQRVEAIVMDLGKFDISQYRSTLPDKAPVPEYHWDFGDGATAVTHTPTVRHDYFAAIDHATGVGQFTVTCTAAHSNVTVRRTLTIHSAYHLCKRLGAVVPHVEADLFAHKVYNRISASFVVHNVEEAPMILDKVSITAHPDDPGSLSLPGSFLALGAPVVIGPLSKTLVSVAIPFVTGTPANGELHYQTTGFTALYAGSVDGHPVRCSAVFDIPVGERNKKPRLPAPPKTPGEVAHVWPWDEVEKNVADILAKVATSITPDDVTLDPKTSTIGISLGTVGATPSKVRDHAALLRSAVLSAGFKQASASQHERLFALQKKLGSKAEASRLVKTFGPKLLSGGGSDMFAPKFLNGPPPVGFVAEGQICDPDNLDEATLAKADEGQLVCQLTDETMEVQMPARWGNARKGDIILSPGGDGIIGGLLVNVSEQHPQWYSHSGIMTRNFDEITHSICPRRPWRCCPLPREPDVWCCPE